MHRSQWANLNRMPVAFRKGTTNQLKEQFIKLWEQWKLTDQKRTPAEAKKLAESSEYYPNTRKFVGYTYSTMDGGNLYNENGAKQMFINICEKQTPEVAATIITVWYNGEWRHLKDVYLQL